MRAKSILFTAHRFARIICARRKSNNMDEIYSKLEAIVSKKIKNQEIKPENDLTSLGLDSLDKAEIMINIEDEFGIEFDEDEMLQVKTVADLQNLIAAKTK